MEPISTDAPPPQEPQHQANQDVVRILDTLAEKPPTEQVEILLSAFTHASQSGGLTDQQIGTLRELLATEELKNRLTAELPRDSEDELKSKARELAASTRAKGMGLVHGHFPRSYQDGKLKGAFDRLGFSLGADLDDKTSYQTRIKLFREASRTWEPGIHTWTSSSEVAYGDNELSPLAQSGWIKYSFDMPVDTIYDQYNRRGTNIRLYTFVPPEIATQIDEAVAQNPLFPNEYFQALYPDLIGTETDTHLKRLPATKLVKIDYRTSSTKPQETIVDYPEPIPY